MPPDGLPPGFPPGPSSGGPFEAQVVVFAVVAGIVAFGIAILVVGSLRASRPEPALTLDPGPPVHASGGSWQLSDAEGLYLEPNRIHVFTVTLVPDETFESAGVRACMRATETFWVWEDSSDANQDNGRERERRTDVVCEIAAPVQGPGSFRAGQPVSWDLAFELDGLVPSTAGDPNILACTWQLVVTVDRRLHQDPQFMQTVIVTEPRDRLNSGIVDEAEFSRYEEAVATDYGSGLTASMIVRPTPTDLAAPAAITVRFRNPRGSIRTRALRLALVAMLDVTDADGDDGEVVLWEAIRPTRRLPPGESEVEFGLPAINRTLPDADLKHGKIRSELRLTVDRPAAPDIRLRRDLCLCLEPPRPERTARTAPA